MFENFFITYHVAQRYAERMNIDPNSISYEKLQARIKNDVKINRLIKIVNIGDVRHVFVRGSKEFIFEKRLNGQTRMWALKTFIKHRRHSMDRMIQLREKQKAKFEGK